MADDRRDQPAFLQFLRRFRHRFGEARDRDADIRHKDFAAGPQLAHAIGEIVPRMPKTVALLHIRRPFETKTAELRRNLAKGFRLFLRARFGAVEFDEEMRLFRQAHVRMQVHCADRNRADIFDPRHGDAHLDDGDDSIDRILRRLERADGGGDALGLTVQPDGQFGDDAERAFRPDHQLRQVIPGGGFARARAGADDPPVGQHDLHRQHVFPHRAVTHRSGAGGAGARHAAERGVGAGVDREHQPGRAQLFVQLLAGDAGLDDRVHVFGVDLQHLVHLAHVQRDPAAKGQRMALQRGADTPWDDRTTLIGADFHDGGDFLRRSWKCDGVRAGMGEIGLVRRVKVAHGIPGADPVSELVANAGDGVFDGHWRSPLGGRGSGCLRAREDFPNLPHRAIPPRQRRGMTCAISPLPARSRTSATAS